MSRTIPVTPRCAARSSFRLDLVPSRRLAAAWFVWLAAAGGSALASPWPWPVGAGICLTVAALGLPVINATILLRGPHAIRAIAGSTEGELQVWIGGASASVPAERTSGSCRLGTQLLVLRLETAVGVHTVCIDGSLHDQSSFRGLCRALRRPVRRAS